MNSYVLDSQPTPRDIPSRNQVADSRRQKRSEFLDLLRRRWPHPCVIGVAVATSELLSVYPVVQAGGDAHINAWFALMLLWRSLPLLLVMVAAAAAQVWMAQRVGLRRLMLILAAVAISAGVSTAQGNIFRGSMPELRLSEAIHARFLYIFWINVTFTLLLVILYEWQLRAEQAATAVREARIADEALEMQTLEARLNGMKARVDPEFLFAVIAHTEAHYTEDVARGELLLDQLIEFLRNTLPRRTDSRAALGSELRLCESYLALESTMRRDSLSFRTMVDRAVLAARFPPSVLLPLLRTLLPTTVPTGQPAAKSISVTMEVRRKFSRLELEITCGAMSQSAPYLLARSRQSQATANAALHTFFGSDANVEVRVSPLDGYSVTLDVPYVSYPLEVPCVAS